MSKPVAVLTDSTARIPEEMLEEPNICTAAYDSAAGRKCCVTWAPASSPGLLLIGIDPATHHAKVWFGRQAAAAKAADLIGIVQKNNPVQTRSKGGENEKGTCI